MRLSRFHNNGFSTWRRTNIYTGTTSCTVQRRYLNFIFKSIHSSTKSFYCRHSFWCLFHFVLIKQKRTYYSVRTYISTLITLDTHVWLPFWHFISNSSFFIMCRSMLEASVNHSIFYNWRNWQFITFHKINRICNLFDKFRFCSFNNLLIDFKICPFWQYFNFFQAINSSVNRIPVFLNNIPSFSSVTFFSIFFHIFLCFFVRNYFGQIEKCRLHNRVCPISKSYFLCDFCCIYQVKFSLFTCKFSFYFIWNIF